MDVTVSKRDLVRLVQRCQGVADKKSTMAVLSNVLLVASPSGELRASATDLYVAVSGAAQATVVQPGRVAVSAKDLFERVKSMPEGPIQVSSSDGATATIRSATSRRQFDVHGMPGDDFPALPEPDANAPTLELPVDAFARLIASTSFSISTDETRAALRMWSRSAVSIASSRSSGSAVGRRWRPRAMAVSAARLSVSLPARASRRSASSIFGFSK